MKGKLGKMRESVQTSKREMEELLPFSRSSNLVLRKGEHDADELLLNIYNPNYHDKAKDASRYLIPYKTFNTATLEISSGNRLYFEVILNLNRATRMVIPISDFLSLEPAQSSPEITSVLVNLGELKIFEKLNQIFGQGKKDKISLFQIENMVSFKLISAGEGTMKPNVAHEDAFYYLLVHFLII